MIKQQINEIKFKEELQNAFDKNDKDDAEAIIGEYFDLPATTAWSILSEYWDFSDCINNIWNRLTLFEV